MLILWVGLFTMLLAMAAFTIDRGVWLGHRRVSQKDADTAARAGALAFVRGGANPQQDACAEAAHIAQHNLVDVPNPRTCKGADPKTTFVPALTCPVYSGAIASIKVSIHRNEPALFSGAFGISGVESGATATACIGAAKSMLNPPPYLFTDSSIPGRCWGQSQRCVFPADSLINFGLSGWEDCTGTDSGDTFCTVNDHIDASVDHASTAQSNASTQLGDRSGCGGDLDDFDDAYSATDGGSPDPNTRQGLVPNVCDGKVSRHIFDVTLIGNGGDDHNCSHDGECRILAFQQFYVEGCLPKDNNNGGGHSGSNNENGNGNHGNGNGNGNGNDARADTSSTLQPGAPVDPRISLDEDCSKGGVPVGFFVRALMPYVGGGLLPLPASSNPGALAIALVK